MNNEHDKTYKSFLRNKKTFLGLLQGFVDEEWTKNISEDNINPVDKSFILKDYEEKEADVVYRLEADGQEYYFYVLLELQSSVDFTMPYRLLQYMTALWDEVFKNTDKKIRARKEYTLPPIVPIVLYNGKPNWTAKMSFKEKQTDYNKYGNHLVDFEYILIDVHRYSDEDLEKVGNFIAAIFMVDKETEDIVKALKRATKIIKRVTPQQWREYKKWLLKMLLPKLAEEKKKEVKEIIEEAEIKEVDKMVMNLERNLDRMIERGIKEGIEQGIEQGVLKVAKNLLELMDDETIAEKTGLSVEKVKKLREEA